MITTWKLNDDDKKVKVSLPFPQVVVRGTGADQQTVRRVRRKLQTQLVSHDVAERKGWAKSVDPIGIRSC